MFYIRFTNDIHRDIEKGESTDFRNGNSLGGLCAWEFGQELDPNCSTDILIKKGKEYAQLIAKNTYGGYSSNSDFAILKGSYIGRSNDGCLISVDEVVSIEKI